MEVSPEDFASYLTANWLSNPGMWCSAFRRDLLTLGNNTTNRIESFNSLVKAELRKRKGVPPSLPELIGILLQIVRRKDADATYKDFRNSATVAINVLLPEMQQAGVLYNDAAFRLLQSQVVKLKSAKLRFHSDENGNSAVEDLVKGKVYEFSPGFNGVLEWTCSFNCAYAGLPCSHLLFANQQRNAPLFETKEISDRWRRVAAWELPAESSDATDFAEMGHVSERAALGKDDSLDFSSADEASGKFFRRYIKTTKTFRSNLCIIESVMSHDAKFSRAYGLCRDMASWMSGLSTAAFSETYSYINGIFESLKAGNYFGMLTILIPVVSSFMYF